MTQRPSWNLATLALALTAGCRACAPEPPLEPTGDSGTIIEDPCCCSGLVGEPVPARGATGVYVHGTFQFQFQHDESMTATFTLQDASGADVALEPPRFSEDGETVSFRAAAPLAPSTRYTLGVRYSCDKSFPLEFTTSATGAAVPPDDVAGRAYTLDLTTALFVEPPGMDALVESLLDELDLRLVLVPEAYDAGTDALTFYGGLASADGTQDLCAPTFSLPQAAAYGAGPVFVVEAPDGLTLDLRGAPVSAVDLSLSGAFTPDASEIVGLDLRVVIDTRSLVPLLALELDEALADDAVCDLIGTFTAGAAQCDACPADAPLGVGRTCMTLHLVNVVATGAPWTPRRVTPEEIDADPACVPPAP